jgi:cyclopropane fatty-acyl-phospholipid synthase-like methyltransferase
LLTGKAPKETGFEHKKSLELWDGIMQESPYSLRVIAIKKLLKGINPNAKILDLGCGGGIGLEMILKNASVPIQLFGADASEKYLSNAKARLERIGSELDNEIAKENLRNTKLSIINANKKLPKKQKFDAVFMSIALNHISEKRRPKLFKEIKDILNKKGVLVIFQLIHQSKFNRNAICWLMHTVPSHDEYPFRDEYVAALKEQFTNMKEYFNGTIIVAKKN